MSHTSRRFLEEQIKEENETSEQKAERRHQELMYLRRRTPCKRNTTEKK